MKPRHQIFKRASRSNKTVKATWDEVEKKRNIHGEMKDVKFMTEFTAKTSAGIKKKYILWQCGKHIGSTIEQEFF